MLKKISPHHIVTSYIYPAAHIIHHMQIADLRVTGEPTLTHSVELTTTSWLWSIWNALAHIEKPELKSFIWVLEIYEPFQLSYTVFQAHVSAAASQSLWCLKHNHITLFTSTTTLTTHKCLQVHLLKLLDCLIATMREWLSQRIASRCKDWDNMWLDAVRQEGKTKNSAALRHSFASKTQNKSNLEFRSLFLHDVHKFVKKCSMYNTQKSYSCTGERVPAVSPECAPIGYSLTGGITWSKMRQRRAPLPSSSLDAFLAVLKHRPATLK